MNLPDRTIVIAVPVSHPDPVLAVKQLLGNLALVEPEWFAEGGELYSRLDQVGLLPEYPLPA